MNIGGYCLDWPNAAMTSQESIAWHQSLIDGLLGQKSAQCHTESEQPTQPSNLCPVAPTAIASISTNMLVIPFFASEAHIKCHRPMVISVHSSSRPTHLNTLTIDFVSSASQGQPVVNATSSAGDNDRGGEKCDLPKCLSTAH